MHHHITIPIILSLGVGVTVYALTLQKEEPRTASTILSIIGATAGLLSIASAISIKSTAGAANGLMTVGSSLRI